MHRYYDPNTGRYITPDPIAVGQLNGSAFGVEPIQIGPGTVASSFDPADDLLFGYAANNPIGYTDPMGLDVPKTCLDCEKWLKSFCYPICNKKPDFGDPFCILPFEQPKEGTPACESQRERCEKRNKRWKKQRPSKHQCVQRCNQWASECRRRLCTSITMR